MRFRSYSSFHASNMEDNAQNNGGKARVEKAKKRQRSLMSVDKRQKKNRSDSIMSNRPQLTLSDALFRAVGIPPSIPSVPQAPPQNTQPVFNYNTKNIFTAPSGSGFTCNTPFQPQHFATSSSSPFCAPSTSSSPSTATPPAAKRSRRIDNPATLSKRTLVVYRTSDGIIKPSDKEQMCVWLTKAFNLPQHAIMSVSHVMNAGGYKFIFVVLDEEKTHENIISMYECNSTFYSCFVMKASDMLEDGAQLILQGYQIPYDVSLFQTADHIQFLQQAMVNNRKTSSSATASTPTITSTSSMSLKLPDLFSPSSSLIEMSNTSTAASPLLVGPPPPTAAALQPFLDHHPFSADQVEHARQAFINAFLKQMENFTGFGGGNS